MNNIKYCQHCGCEIDSNQSSCPECGRQVESIQPQQIHYHQQPMGSRDKWVALILCYFLGVFGAHKFYEGKPFIGLIYIFTLGFFGIGVLVDLFTILVKPNRYY